MTRGEEELAPLVGRLEEAGRAFRGQPVQNVSAAVRKSLAPLEPEEHRRPRPAGWLTGLRARRPGMMAQSVFVAILVVTAYSIFISVRSSPSVLLPPALATPAELATSPDGDGFATAVPPAGVLSPAPPPPAPTDEAPGAAEKQPGAPSLITVREIERFDEVEPCPGFEAPPGSTLSRRVATLDEARAIAGFLYVPSELPSGLQLFETAAAAGRVFLTYVNADTSIAVVQETSTVCPGVKRGYVERISVGGRPAYWIRGVWSSLSGPGMPTTHKWEPDGFVQLLFQIDDTVISLMSKNPKHRADMIEIAEAMAPYESASGKGAKIEPSGPSLITVFEIEDMREVELPQVTSTPENYSSLVRVSLEDAEERAGFTPYVPSQAPEGFQLFDAKAARGSLILNYANVGADTTIEIRQYNGVPRWIHRRYVRPGGGERISIGGRPAYIIRGLDFADFTAYFADLPPGSIDEPVNPGVEVLFQIDDTVISVWSRHLANEADTVRFAESLEPYGE